MRGIAGILRMDGGKIESDWLTEMASRMVHSGPDDQGFWSHTFVGLAPRRLSIIDLKTGNQPPSNKDGSIWVVLNGEISNFRELRRELESRGHVCKTPSDTEVLVSVMNNGGKNS